MAVFTNVQKEDVLLLLKKGYTSEEPKTIYEALRLRHKTKPVALILFTSGKLMVQGKEEFVEKVVQSLKKIGIGKLVKKEVFRKETGQMIGSDESLKGDTFGGLVVAAVKADAKSRIKLMEMGVADSKKLQDKEIMAMAEKIKKAVPCEIISILPEEYNKHSKVTVMLNKYHKQCANYLAPGQHVVDKYPGCNVGDIRETKAESKYLEVAAASILARATALKQLNYLSIKAGFSLPKGSTHVELALIELKERGLDFNKFVKTGFGNVVKFLQK